MAEDSQAIGSFFSDTLGTQQIQEPSDLTHLEPRQANLFLIDTSSKMFKEDPQCQEIPFMKSILTYRNNMQLLCGFNRDDWMSLVLFGTNEWDKDPEMKNVLTVQKFQKVSFNMLKEIKKKIEDTEDSFKLLACSTTYPLNESLWLAAQSFAAVKTVLISRKIVLFTNEDNPFPDDPNERHRIRTRVATFKNLGVDFRVVGLKEDFNHDIFYKELEIIASGMSPSSYKTLKFDDLEAEIQFPARTISNIPWRFNKDVQIPVSIFSISTATKYPESVYINRTTNEMLKSSTVYRKVDYEDGSMSIEDEIENEEKFSSDVVAAGGVAKFQEHGGKKIVFDVKEISMMFDHFTKGVEILGFKQLECDPMYHVEAPKFLTYSVGASESQKQFFVTLLDQCEAQDLMAVCRITYRLHTAPNIFYFYPCVKKGGFYVYKMAYEDQVRNLDDVLSNWILKKDWEHFPSQEALDIFEKIIKKTRIRFDPSVFKNPKLERLIVNIEALALDLNQKIVPADSTLPSQKMQQRLAEILPEYNRLFPQEEPPAKRMRLACVIDDTKMRQYVQLKQVDNCTVPQLKDFLKGKGIQTFNCRKADLVQKVYQFHVQNV